MSYTCTNCERVLETGYCVCGCKMQTDRNRLLLEAADQLFMALRQWVGVHQHDDNPRMRESLDAIKAYGEAKK